MTRIGCAAPGYLAAAGTPEQPGDLLAHRALVYNHLESPAEWSQKPSATGYAVRQRVVPALGIRNSIGLRDAALAGMGVTLIPEFIVAEDLRAERFL